MKEKKTMLKDKPSWTTKKDTKSINKQSRKRYRGNLSVTIKQKNRSQNKKVRHKLYIVSPRVLTKPLVI